MVGAGAGAAAIAAGVLMEYRLATAVPFTTVKELSAKDRFTGGCTLGAELLGTVSSPKF